MPVKVCPRCRYVDVESRRVCVACRGSLMGTAASELHEVLELRDQVLGAGDDGERAPWGPGLAAIIGRTECAAGTAPDSVAPPTVPPRPVRSPGRDTVEADLRRLEAVPSSRAPVANAPADLQPAVARTAAFDVSTVIPPVVARAGRLDPAPTAAPGAPSAPPSPPVRTPTVPGGRAARDERTPRAQTRPAPEPRSAARSGGASTVASREASPRTRRIRRILAVTLVLLVGLAGGRAVTGGFGADERSVVADPSTPLDELPWHTQALGAAKVRVPSPPAVGAGSSYQRYALPDIELAIAVRAAVPTLDTDAALRTYASQLVAQLGGRYVDGRSQGSSFGAGFSAETQLDGTRVLVYLLSAPDALVEVQGTILDASSARATAIFDRVVNSIEVG